MPDEKTDGADENLNPSDNQSSSDDQKGTAPKKTEAGSQETFDPKVIGDGDFEKIFDDPRVWTHPRFKSLIDAKNELKEIRAKEEKEREKKLLEEKKYKELLESKDAKIAELTTAQQNLLLDQRISSAAVAAGVADIDAVLKLVNRGNIKINEDGSVAGVDEALKQLLTDKPYLQGAAPNVTVGSGTNPGSVNSQGAKRYKLSQLQDPTFFKENEADIMQSMKLGLVEDDTNR